MAKTIWTNQDNGAWGNAVSQWDKEGHDREMLNKLSLFTSYFYAIEDVSKVMPMNAGLSGLASKIPINRFVYTPRTPQNIFIYRAVDKVELIAIHKLGKFELQVGGTEAKYFANSPFSASKYGTGTGTLKGLYPNGFNVVRGRIRASSASSVWSPHTDDIGAYIIHEPMLSTVKFVK